VQGYVMRETVNDGIAIKQPKMRRESSSTFINAFLVLSLHVSPCHCHHKGVMIFSEAATSSPHFWLYYNYSTKMLGPTIKNTIDYVLFARNFYK
jgi:hypothetical protein